MLELNDFTRPLARKRVTRHDYPDGRTAIRYEGQDLPHRIFDKLQKVDLAVGSTAIIWRRGDDPMTVFDASLDASLGVGVFNPQGRDGRPMGDA